MDIQLTTQTLRSVKSDVLIVGAARKKDSQDVLLSSTATTIDKLLDGLISELCMDGEFKGDLGELLTVHTMKHMITKRVIVVGLGTQVNTQAIRQASAIAARHAQSTGANQIALALNWQDGTSVDGMQEARAQVEGALLGLYTFRMYQHTDDSNKGVSSIQLVAAKTDKQDLTQAIHQASILAEATNFARDLVNEPPNMLTPGELANRASLMAKQFGMECEVLDKPQIEELRMGGLLGVSQGSAQPPQFIIVHYQGNHQSSEKGLALVGKGITFDSGGLSIKPADRMDEMKSDMAGAAAVLGAMQAIAALKLPLNVTALVPTCENMPSATAYRPGDILRMMNGKTIEIVNTDAEGRLVLADALSYAAKEGFSPIVDLATLTGGVIIALGHAMTGLFCNDEQLTDEICAAGRVAGEKYWPMPLDEDYQEHIKSDIADIKQTGGRPASSVTAAKILEHFVGDAKWAHLDIAGTSYLDSKKPYQEKGATGVGVRTLAELALQLAK